MDRKPTIGILTGWSAQEGGTPDHYLGSVLKGIQSAAQVRNCHLLLAWGVGRVTDTTILYPAWPESTSETDFVPVGPWNTDGLIIFTPLRSEKRSNYVQNLIKEGFPVIFIASGETEPSIAVDSDKGIHQAVSHLVEHGHRQIAYIAGQPTDKGDSHHRLEAFYQAMKENLLEVSQNLIAEGWHTVPGGYKAMREILRSGEKFSAVVASNDNSAIGAMQAIQEAGFRIPQDIAIIGFDDQPDAIAQIPPLASVHVPLALVGEQALVMMLDHLGSNAPLESVRIPTRLVKRRSCGCMPEAVAAAGMSTPRPRYVKATKTGPLVKELEEEKDQLVSDMLAVLPAELRFPGEDRFRLTCDLLVGAFYKSLLESDSKYFRSALMESIYQLEAIGDKLDPWQDIISTMRRKLTQMSIYGRNVKTKLLAEDLFHQARVAISESAERYDKRSRYQREIAAKSLSELTAQLSGTLDETRAVGLLEAHLSEIGIRKASIILFQPEKEDQVAWSLLLKSDPQAGQIRFSSRQFPPDGLYSRDELLHIALFPLVFQDEALGYIAFDADDLESCAVITRQLAATINAARLHAKVIELSLTDALTGLHNRRYFDLFLKNEVNRHQRIARDLAIIFMDIDDFKGFNDTYGHPAGDEVLKQVAACLSRGRRSADIVARFGGDEFVLILPETDVTGGLEVMKKIRGELSKLTTFDRPITVSAGLTALRGLNLDTDLLLGQADKALYSAKRNGKNRLFVIENGELRDEMEYPGV